MLFNLSRAHCSLSKKREIEWERDLRSLFLFHDCMCFSAPFWSPGTPPFFTFWPSTLTHTRIHNQNGQMCESERNVGSRAPLIHTQLRLVFPCFFIKISTVEQIMIGTIMRLEPSVKTSESLSASQSRSSPCPRQSASQSVTHPVRQTRCSTRRHLHEMSDRVSRVG